MALQKGILSVREGFRLSRIQQLLTQMKLNYARQDMPIQCLKKEH
jgi:hypothetical protein